MRLFLETDKASYRAGESFTVRLVAYNDRYEPVSFDRTLLIGPNPLPEDSPGIPLPVSLEFAFKPKTLNSVGLNAFCYYGREREFSFRPGRVVFYAYLLSAPAAAFPPQWTGPADQALVAEPLEITIE